MPLHRSMTQSQEMPVSLLWWGDVVILSTKQIIFELGFRYGVYVKCYPKQCFLAFES